MKNKINFNTLVEHAVLNDKHAALKTVIEKELIHYDILFALSQHQLLDQLTFQGGTALRLCYRSKRFSEDLDFVGGADFNREKLMPIKEVLEKYIGERYGLAISVKEPKEMKMLPERSNVNVDIWQISVTTKPANKDLPRQKVKIEIANVPAYTRELRPLAKNYDFLPDGYSEIFIGIETLDEILADKIIAYTARHHLKARDVWDMPWLLQQGAELKLDFVRKKIEDYKIKDFLVRLNDRIKELEPFIMSKPFFQEMSRFLDREVSKQSIEKEGFLAYLIKSNRDLLERVRERV